MRTRQILTYPTGSPNEVHSIIIMFVHTRSYGKDVRVKDNIMRIKAHFLNQKLISAGTHFNLTFVCIRLSSFIKSHYYGSRTILPDRAGMFQKLFFSLFQRD